MLSIFFRPVVRCVNFLALIAFPIGAHALSNGPVRVCGYHYQEGWDSAETELIKKVDARIQTSILAAASRAGETAAANAVSLVSAKGSSSTDRYTRHLDFVHVLTLASAQIQFTSAFWYDRSRSQMVETDDSLTDALGRVIRPATVHRCEMTLTLENPIFYIMNASTQLGVATGPFKETIRSVLEYP